MRRISAIVGLIALLAVACSAPEDSSSSADAESNAVDTQQSSLPGSPREPIRAIAENCEPGQFHWDQPTCQPAHSIPLNEIIAGGPPPDGIPPIDNPVYESVEAAASWLSDSSPVMVVDIDNDVRAYPLAILTWHEIVNDTVGDIPLVITYCPLCNSALVFKRTIDGEAGEEVLDFGTSGRLYLSNLVMYDRQHRNLWTQFEGEAVVGEDLIGTQLTRVPAWLFGFQQLAELHPDAQVLSRDTGHNRDYGRNPYTFYDAADSDPFLFRGDLDARQPPMTRLVGVTNGTAAVGITLDHLSKQRTIDVRLENQKITVLWAPGQSSALDLGTIDQGRDVGQTAAFVAEIDGDELSLRSTEIPNRFVDKATGSTFDLRGRALDGPYAGRQLTPVAHDDTFWFVWVAFRPDTALVGG